MIHNLSDEDKNNYKHILIGLNQTLSRILSKSVGIGNHFEFFRPLLDPMQSIVKKDQNISKQLIGIEYFNINRYISHLIDIYNIKIFIVIEVLSDNELWFLDHTNIQGESIVENGNNFIGYKIFVNNAIVEHKDLPNFYNSFRKREYFWNWFQYNRTTYNEIRDFLRKNEKERLSNFRLNTYAHELGLLNANDLTVSGMSLIGLKEWR